MESLLHWMERLAVFGQSFDSGDAATVCLNRQHGAAFHSLAIDMDSAGTALAGVAAHMRAGQPQVVAQGMNKQRIVRQIKRRRLTVHVQRYLGHNAALSFSALVLHANLWHVRRNAKTYRYRYNPPMRRRTPLTWSKSVGLILLAAGRSERFGAKDKLAHDWRGKPLVRHVADRLAAMPFAAHLAIVTPDNATRFPDCFEEAVNKDPARGLSHSIALGIGALAERDLDACLIALGDMPLVPRQHFAALVDALETADNAIVASANGGRAQVPALFAAKHFAELAQLAGDNGARDLLSTATTVHCAPDLLADFDRPEDFARYAK